MKLLITYVMLICSLSLIAYCGYGMEVAWHMHDIPHLLFNAVFLIINGVLFTILVVLSAKFRRGKS